MEKLKKCPSYPGYFADYLGFVWSTKRGYPQKLSLCESQDGYWRVFHAQGSKGAHIFVCDAFHGPKPSSKHQVRHLDGNRKNNSPENLKWGTSKENAADRTNHGNCKMNDNAKVGYKKRFKESIGVIKAPSGRWRAYIKIKRITQNLGTYDTFEEAKKVRDEAVVRAMKEGE